MSSFTLILLAHHFFWDLRFALFGRQSFWHNLFSIHHFALQNTNERERVPLWMLRKLASNHFALIKLVVEENSKARVICGILSGYKLTETGDLDWIQLKPHRYDNLGEFDDSAKLGKSEIFEGLSDSDALIVPKSQIKGFALKYFEMETIKLTPEEVLTQRLVSRIENLEKKRTEAFVDIPTMD